MKLKPFFDRLQIISQRPGAGLLLLGLTGLGISLFLMLGLALSERASGAKPPEEPSAPRKALTLAVPTQGAYTGAYIDFGAEEDDVTLEAIEKFEQQVGKHQAIVASSSYWGEQTFPTSAVQIVSRHGSIPLIFWSPWDRPYLEDLIMANGPDKFALDKILTGQWNDYIDRWARAARDFGQPMFVSLCNEMNGNWFPWGGPYYGGGKPIPNTNPVRYEGPETFKRAYRYIVDRVRAQGARNILWVFHLNNFSEPMEPWSAFAQYYPGPDYADWLGISAYGQLFPNSKWNDFASIIESPYAELAQLDPTKPLMLTEWGVGEFPASGDKAKWIEDAFNDIPTKYPRVRAAIFWHERWQNTNTKLYSNLRVNSSQAALAAYRRGVALPYWLDQPIYR
jgi:hypothetical protein